MRATAEPPMAQWRSWPARAAFARSSRAVRDADQSGLAAGLIHGRQLAAMEIDHSRREPALAGKPLPYLLRIDGHQKLGSATARDRSSVAVRMPCGVEPEGG